MALPFTENSTPLRHNCCSISFRAALLFAVGLAGCNNTCFTFTSNPPVGTIGIVVSNPSPACTLTKANGAVRVQARTVPVCSSCPSSGRVQHLFVTIRGIAVHPMAMADDDSPDWRELLPTDVAKQPIQIDLVGGTSDQNARVPLGEFVAIPAGIYRQVRMRFEPAQPAAEDRLPEKNACGSLGFNCVVLADGRVQPLLLDGRSPELRITSDRMEGAALLFPPDANSDLVIEGKLVWAYFSSGEEHVRLLPTLTASAKVARVKFDE